MQYLAGVDLLRKTLGYRSNNDVQKKQNVETIINQPEKCLAMPETATIKAYYLPQSLDRVKAPEKIKLPITFGQKALSEIQPGAHYDPKTARVNFGVFSENAEKIELWIYNKPIGEEIKRINLTRNPDNSWSTSISASELAQSGIDIKKGDTLYYGYRAWGPNWKYDSSWQPGSNKGFVEHVDNKGNRFNPNKLLTDPYAKEISHDPRSPKVQGVDDNTIFATGPKHALKDSGPLGSKSILVKTDNVSTGKKPQRAFKDDIVYETHVRGLTKLDPSIPEKYRGTYKGAAIKAKELSELGITAIEFLPVQETCNDANNEKEGNYWGYATLNYFAPDRRYAADKSAGGPTREFKEMVKAFHDQGIKVYIDVVYNHTGEGGLWNNDAEVANLYSMRGLDNQTYYETSKGKHYYDNTGCGANVNVTRKATRDFVLDSLKYWANDLGVDGFRFDLASVLGNSIDKDGFKFDRDDPSNIINRAVRELPVRGAEGGKGVDLIAEPWAIGEGTYQVGGFPKAWSEWNDQYRDIMRKAENKFGVDNVTPGQLASKIAGSSDIYQHNGRKPWNSLNFITAHDGFTLKDLYSYNQKNNIGSDGGSDNNISWDHHGDASQQRQAVRNAFTLLMASAGVPMVVGGDEMLRTTNGNNNPYNLDTKLNWLKWNLDKDQKTIRTFVQRAINFRKEHKSLRPSEFYEGKDHNNNQLKDLTWYTPNGYEPEGAYFSNPNNHFIAYRLDDTEFDKDTKSSSVYVAYNKGAESVNVKLPPNLPGKKWHLTCNTSRNLEKQGNFHPIGKEIPLQANDYTMDGRSLMILIEK